MTQEWLKLTAVDKGYRLAAEAPPVHVLQALDLEVKRGDSLAIIGPSGSGKSTLLNLVGALEKPDAGTVSFEGRDLTSLDDRELAVFRSEKIGFIFQSHHLLPHCTVWENVLLPGLALKTRPGEDVRQKRAEKLLKRVGLLERARFLPWQLSGGERQRVAVARALMNQPALLLADEPTGALDRANAAQLGRLLLELNVEEGVTLMVVTHALDLARLLGQARELREGKLWPANL